MKKNPPIPSIVALFGAGALLLYLYIAGMFQIMWVLENKLFLFVPILSGVIVVISTFNIWRWMKK